MIIFLFIITGGDKSRPTLVCHMHTTATHTKFLNLDDGDIEILCDGEDCLDGQDLWDRHSMDGVGMLRQH